MEPWTDSHRNKPARGLLPSSCGRRAASSFKHHKKQALKSTGMASSFHLCYCKTISNSQAHSELRQSLVSTTSQANQISLLSTKLPSLKPSSITSSSFSTKSGISRKTHIFNHIEESSEPLVSGEESPLRIGIVGFGNFGQFIAKGLQRQNHKVLATSRSDYSEYCEQHGIEFYGSLDALCEEQPDVVFVCSSILSTESVIRKIPMHKLKPDTIFADVLSVKQFPRNLFLEVLPPGFGIVCTHPMFGPESGKNGWAGLPFVFDKVRITENSAQEQKCRQFLSIFENEGCQMVEMSCEEHDRHAAGSQFITHTIGRILSHLNLESTPINTKGYETLLQLTENTVSDSFDLYYGLFMYNVNATEQIENLDRAFETVKQKLFGRLHDILRKQIVERVPVQGMPTKYARDPSPYFLPSNHNMTDLTSFAVPPAPPSPAHDSAASGAATVQKEARSMGGR